MNRKKLFEIGRKLGAFELGQLQDFLTLVKILNRNGISREAFVEYVETTPAHPPTSAITPAGQELYKLKWPECPDHGVKLAIGAIPPDNVKGYKARWFCPFVMAEDPAEICPFERLDQRNIQQVWEDFYINQEITLPEAS